MEIVRVAANSIGVGDEALTHLDAQRYGAQGEACHFGHLVYVVFRAATGVDVFLVGRRGEGLGQTRLVGKSKEGSETQDGRTGWSCSPVLCASLSTKSRPRPLSTQHACRQHSPEAS